MLHGYHVQTEGVRFVLKPERLKAFATNEAARLAEDAPRREWHLAQMLRFLVESGAQAAGLNTLTHGAQQNMVSANADPDLRPRLNHLMRFWSAPGLSRLSRIPWRLLCRRPLLSARCA